MDKTDMTVRELLAALEAVPEQYRDLEVTVHVTPEIEIDKAEGDAIARWLWTVTDGIPGRIYLFSQFPANIEDPQPVPVNYCIYANEGLGVAGEVDTLKMMGEFQAWREENPDA